MRPLVNPGVPTPLGWGYYLMDPSARKAVEFDDCQQESGDMVDYKHKYWKLCPTSTRKDSPSANFGNRR